MSLTHSADKLMADVGDEGPEVRCELLDWIRTGSARDDVNPAVVIEEHRKVVPSGQLIALPRTINRLGAEDLEAGAVHVGENAEHPVVIADAGCPDAATIDIPSFKAIGLAKIKFVRAIADEIPVHQIRGMHDLNRRVHMHRGAREVKVMADADHIWVFKLLVEQRVRVGTIAIVSGPMPRRRGRDSARNRMGVRGATTAQGNKAKEANKALEVFHRKIF